MTTFKFIPGCPSLLGFGGGAGGGGDNLQFSPKFTLFELRGKSWAGNKGKTFFTDDLMPRLYMQV